MYIVLHHSVDGYCVIYISNVFMKRLKLILKNDAFSLLENMLEKSKRNSILVFVVRVFIPSIANLRHIGFGLSVDEPLNMPFDLDILTVTIHLQFNRSTTSSIYAKKYYFGAVLR